MKNIIFVAGLDDRTGDLDLTQQTALISKGYGPGADIESFRYKAATGLVTKSITDNPGAVIILFSAGCAKSKAIADHLKSINQPLNLLHINEPYTCSVNTANIVNSAIALGVPKTNVYSGGSDCTGNNISGHGKLVGRTSHFQSLTPLGKLIASLKPETAATPAATPVTAATPPAQTKSVIATGPGKDFINKFNEELEKVYTEATTKLGPWKKAREEAIKITKPRIGTWPVDPAVKTIGDLFAYVFLDPDGLKFNSPPWYQIKVEGSPQGFLPDAELQKQYNDWINDMNGAMPLPASPTGALVLDPTISAIFKSLAWPYEKDEPGYNTWNGKFRNSNRPIVLPKTKEIIENYNEIKKTGITNPDKYSAGQWWFDVFMSEVIGLNGRYGYLKSKSDGSTNERIEEAFGKSRYSYKFLDSNKKTEGDTNLYTISVSKFVKGETVPYSSTASGVFDRHNYTDYGSGDQESSSGKEYPGYGFAKILELIERRQRENNFSKPPNIEYGGFDLFESLKTQYRPGVNSLESLSKDPLFNPMRTSIDDEKIDWSGVGITQSQETGIYWEYPVGSTASVVGNFENILLYNAFLEAGDDYKTITLPKYAPVAEVDTPVTSTLTPTTESKFSGEFTFNVEKEKTFVVVGNQNFTLKIGDLAIEGLTTSSAIDSPKTIDLGDGIVIIDDGESDEDIYEEGKFAGNEEEVYKIMQVNQIDDVPAGPSFDEKINSETAGEVNKSEIGKGPILGSKLTNKTGTSMINLAGHRLTPILKDLENYLNNNGFGGAKIGNNGVMRDLRGSAYPSSPARASASLHGAGLAIDVTFNIPGFSWKSIYDNGNLSKDAKLTKVINNFVKGQGDITWGAVWGGSKPADGIVTGRGITEYHHFEIRADLIPKYWEPVKDELVKFGFKPTDLKSPGKGSNLHKLMLKLLGETA